MNAPFITPSVLFDGYGHKLKHLNIDVIYDPIYSSYSYLLILGHR